MSRDRIRFTAWLSRSEKDAIATEAERLGSSENFVVRTAVRQFLGFGNPAEIDAPLSHLSRVTPGTEAK